MQYFCDEELLATHTQFILEDHPLLAVHDCLLNTKHTHMSIFKYRRLRKQGPSYITYLENTTL